MSKQKEITVSDFIQTKANRKNKMMIHIESLGGDIEATRLPMKQVLQLVDGIEKASTVEQMQMSCKLIYQSCKIFRDEELQKAFENPQNPEDIVMLALNEDLGVVGSIAEQIMSFYKIVSGEELKN